VEVFLCRHGETEHNCTDTIQGQSKSEMTQKGIEQAEKLRERFEDENIDSFYSSSMHRARKTAEIVADPHEADISFSKKLKEICRAEFEGESFEELIEEIESSDTEDHLWKPEGGENLKELKERATSFLGQLTENHGDETILVVSHSGTISAALVGLISHSARESWRIRQENCCVNKVSWSKDRGWMIDSVNETWHLEDT